MNSDSPAFRLLRSAYRAINARLFRRIERLEKELAVANDQIGVLASVRNELETARTQVESSRNDSLWAREEARHVRDLMDEKYAYKDNRVGSQVRDQASIASIRARLQELGPWQGPYDFGSGIRAPRQPTGVVSEQQRERFDNLNRYQDEDFFRRRATRLFHAVEAYADPKTSTFVDVGCADGYFSIAAAKRGYKKVLGLDVRQENIDRARYAAELFGLQNVTFGVDNVYDLGSIANQKFDVVVCQGVMYHLTHPILALQKLRAVTGNVAFIGGWTAIGEGAKLDLRTDDVGFFLDGDQEIVAIPTYEGLRQAMKLVAFQNVLEVIRPGLGPTGEWREFLGFAK